MSKKLLVIDSGHNEYVKGKEAPDKSMREWEFNNSMQYAIKSRSEDHGILVYLTNPNPAKKDEIGLSNRCNLANNKWKAEGKPKAMFISLHANAYSDKSKNDKEGFNSARGTETFVATNASSASKNFAKSVNDEIYKTMKSLDSGALNRGVKVSNYTVIYKTNLPCVLVEYGFYTNRGDLNILKNNRAQLVEATVKAICSYFGVTYVPPKSPTGGKFEHGKSYKGRKAKVVKCTTLNVRYDRGTQHAVVATLKEGQVVDVDYCLNNWIGLPGYKGVSGFGYVNTNYLQLI